MRSPRALNTLAALALSCSTLAVGLARAAPPSGMATDVDVEPLVQRGIDLRRTGQEVAALNVFEDALVRSPTSTRVKVHLAATHQALGQWVEAERYLSEALSATDDPYIHRHRATLEKAYDFVDRRLGSLDVVGGPEGAELMLSGRPIGQLPLSAPVRVPIGSYLLEVRKEGYYSISRPIAMGGGSLLRESVTLARREGPAPAWTAETSVTPSEVDAARGNLHWITWTLGGAGIGAAAVSAIAFGIREKHASTWNGDGCLQPGLTRGQVCPDELESGRNAERWGIGTGILSGVLLGGAAASLLLERRAPSEGSNLALDGCGVEGMSARCFGSF
jgi:PEGA domain